MKMFTELGVEEAHGGAEVRQRLGEDIWEKVSICKDRGHVQTRKTDIKESGVKGLLGIYEFQMDDRREWIDLGIIFKWLWILQCYAL